MINPKAYLRSIKNVEKGLRVRSKIIDILSKGGLSVGEISRRSGMPPTRIRYHLRNMKVDGVVKKHRAGKQVVWQLTGIGQASLEEMLGLEGHEGS